MNIPCIVDHLGYQSSPATLMAGTKTAAGVAIEELVEPNIVLPVGVIVKHFVAGMDGSLARIIANHEML